MSKPVLIPGPDHPITIAPAAGRVIVRAGDELIAETGDALVLQEARYPAVHYVPCADVAMAALVPTDHHTYCPYKGEASYYSIPALGERGVNAVWSYEEPHEAVAAIAGHLAFYTDRVDVTEPGDSAPA